MDANSDASLDGLSPPTRGNLDDTEYQYTGERSIPAHAGEPKTFCAAASFAGVYPRPRGGTGDVVIAADSTLGLSPPTRGNLSQTSST